MEGQDRAPHLDVVVAALAERQHGVVSRRQLREAGMSETAIAHRLVRRRLQRIHPAVYTLALPLLPRARYMAAVLACGKEAVLSHRSAAALWDLRAAPKGPVDVSIERAGGRSRCGISVHATRSLPTFEITRHDGVPCTTPARTLVDLASVLTPRRLRRALDQAEILRIFDLTALEAAIDRGRGRRGVATLRRLVADLHEPPPVRSELERRFLELVAEAGLPAPVVNAPIANLVVDFQWPAQRLVVEVDGRATHDTAHAFEEDRRRDLELRLAGWEVARVSWRQVVRRPDRVAALLRSRLAPA